MITPLVVIQSTPSTNGYITSLIATTRLRSTIDSLNRTESDVSPWAGRFWRLTEHHADSDGRIWNAERPRKISSLIIEFLAPVSTMASTSPIRKTNTLINGLCACEKKWGLEQRLLPTWFGPWFLQRPTKEEQSS